jgi:urease accessory protein
MKLLAMSDLEAPVATPVAHAGPAHRATPPSDGSGSVELALLNGRTQVIRLASQSPLRLLSPRHHVKAAWIVAGSYGGGLLARDRLGIDLQCRAGTTTILSTQASTKVYRASSGPGASGQRLTATLAALATLISWPDPVTCFAGARYEQAQSFHLEPSSSLLAVDWLTSGRMARGERWEFNYYSSRTTVHVNGELKIHETLTLDPRDGSLDAPARAGGMNCLGVAWVIGPQFDAAAQALLQRLARSPIDPRRDVLFAISSLTGGAVIRFAGRSTEAVTRWLRQQLKEAVDVAGFDPWSRRGDTELAS